MNQTSRFINISNKEKDYSTDSETDSSLASDNDSTKVTSIPATTKTSFNEMNTTKEINCCLICSILSSLSSINCCPKHLSLLTTASSAQIVYMMPSTVNDWTKLVCHCPARCSKSKRRHRSYSSSEFQHRKKQRSISVQSSNITSTDDLLLSPNIERTTSSHIESQQTSNVHEKHQSDDIQFSSSSFLSSSLIYPNMNKNNSYERSSILSSSSLSTKSKQRNINQKKRIVQNENNQSNSQKINNQSMSSDLIELDSDTSYSPRILLKRVDYAKEDGEELTISNSQIFLNMTQATKQMIAQQIVKPKILLKRVYLET